MADGADTQAGTHTGRVGKQGEPMGDANRQGMGEGGVATMTPAPQPAPQPQQEYIITEDQMEDLHAFLHINYERLGVKILQAVHTRPHASTPVLTEDIDEIRDICEEKIEQMKTGNTSLDEISEAYQYIVDVLPEHDTAIRKAERERVLDEMESFAVSDIPEGYMDDTAKTNGQWVRKIKSLRGEP